MALARHLCLRAAGSVIVAVEFVMAFLPQLFSVRSSMCFSAVVKDAGVGIPNIMLVCEPDVVQPQIVVTVLHRCGPFGCSSPRQDWNF